MVSFWAQSNWLFDFMNQNSYGRRNSPNGLAITDIQEVQAEQQVPLPVKVVKATFASPARAVLLLLSVRLLWAISTGRTEGDEAQGAIIM